MSIIIQITINFVMNIYIIILPANAKQYCYNNINDVLLIIVSLKNKNSQKDSWSFFFVYHFRKTNYTTIIDTTFSLYVY